MKLLTAAMNLVPALEWMHLDEMTWQFETLLGAQLRRQRHTLKATPVRRWTTLLQRFLARKPQLNRGSHSPKCNGVATFLRSMKYPTARRVDGTFGISAADLARLAGRNQVDFTVEGDRLAHFNHNFRKWNYVAFPKPIIAHPAALVETFEEGVGLTEYTRNEAVSAGFRFYKLCTPTHHSHH
eukprot:1186492-Prorocentrum_minimum.AAC.4